jgi:cytochrome c556
MEKTLEGLQAGAIKLPRNQQRMQEFGSADKRFHENLEALDQAAQKRDLPKMLYLSKQLLDGCVKCHQIFRK